MVKESDNIHIVPGRASVGQAHLVRENGVSDTIDSVWVVNYHVDLATYWTVYQVTMSESRCAGGRLLFELYYLI